MSEGAAGRESDAEPPNEQLPPPLEPARLGDRRPEFRELGRRLHELNRLSSLGGDPA